MRFMALKEMPSHIGEASIAIRPRRSTSSWEQTKPLAARVGKELHLSESDDARFFPLMKGQQFLYTAADNDRRRLFFGGMDESPFLVELQYSLIEVLIEGENAFYQALKPTFITSAETIFSNVARRQGDFFAVRPKKRMDMVKVLMTHLKNQEVTFSVVEDQPLKETRHRFKGLLGRIGHHFIGEGTISAPDHEQLVLDGPHVIGQSFGLVSPKTAD